MGPDTAAEAAGAAPVRDSQAETLPATAGELAEKDGASESDGRVWPSSPVGEEGGERQAEEEDHAHR
eukprot:2287459-Amphidinium_carterae.2